MKKNFQLLSLLFLSLLILTACGSSEEPQSKTYQQSINGMDTEITLTYQSNGDVTKQQSKISMPYSLLGVDSDEAAQELLTSSQGGYANISGVEESITTEEGIATVDLTIDFEALNNEELESVGGSEFNTNVMSIDEVEENLLQQGFELVE